MKFLPLLLILCAFLSCKDDSVKAQGDQTVVGQVDPREPLRQGPAKDSGRYLTLRMGSGKAKRGQKICLPVEASGFKELIGFQYTIRFDSAALSYESVRSFNLPGYQASSFGDRFVERGYLSSLWTDLALKGTSLSNDHRLFEVCFTNLMDEGESTEVKFVDGPTSFEVIDKSMVELQFVHANGRVISN